MKYQYMKGAIENASTESIQENTLANYKEGKTDKLEILSLKNTGKKVGSHEVRK